MSFPIEDKYWKDTRDFVCKYIKENDIIVAPIEFKECFGENVIDYASYINEDMTNWLIVHKGLIENIDYELIEYVNKHLIPVYANDVFVIFSNREDMTKMSDTSQHIKSYWEKLKKRGTKQKNGKTILRNDIKDDCELNLEEQSEKLNMNLYNKIVRHLGSKKNISSMSREEMEISCRANCQNVYLGNNTVLCRVLTKFMLYADTEDVGIVPHLCLNGYWEPWITIALARLLQKDWHCIDIGANHGYYTILMADIVGPLGKVLAIEPNPKLTKMLEKTINVNGFEGFTHVLQKAVSDRDNDKVELAIPRGFGMNATIWRDATSDDDVVVVDTLTLDDLTKDFNVDLIKIDAEGAEEKIWKGMGEMLCRNKDIIVIMEFNYLRYADPKAFLEEIQNKGFNLRYIDYDSKIKETTIYKCMSERVGEDWMLFLRH